MLIKKNIPADLLYTKNKNASNKYTNLLLIDRAVNNFQQVFDSVNSSTFAVVYSINTSKTELLSLIKKNFSSISKIGFFCVSSLDKTKPFLDYKPLFLNDESKPYSENVEFIINIIKNFKVKNIDFLACDTLNYSNWVNYYDILKSNTGVIVGASNDKTGNIKYGGNWVMESTSQDIELIYFTKSIEYYSYLLDNPSWASVPQSTTGSMCFYDNYFYFPTNSNIVQINLDGTINNPEWAIINTDTSYNLISCIAYNGYLYVTNLHNVAGYSSTICKILISDPTDNPEYNWVTGLYNAGSMAIQGDYLYVTGNDVISKIYLPDPTFNPEYTWAGFSQDLDGPGGMCIYNNYLYVSNNNYNGSLNEYANTICKISLQDPNDFTVNWANSTQGLNAPYSLAVYNNYLYVSNIGTEVVETQSISKISLNDPTNDFTPSWVQSTNAPSSTDPAIFGMMINGNYLYSYNPSTNVISQYSLPLVCFKEDTKILTDKGYVKIQELKKGDLVKTVKHDYKPIFMIGKRDIYHPMCQDRIKDQLYKCSQDKYPEVFEDLVLTGCHSILVDKFVSEEERATTIEVNGNVYGTDNKYRLPACVDERAVVYDKPGNYTIYHLALENENYYKNYGIYANGLLVESCSKRYLKELSNMVIIE
jgi:hypothetical protein